MRPTVVLLAMSAGFAASPGWAQAAPPNPFASNYPSAPPRVERPERDRAGPSRRRLPPRTVEKGLLPPAEIPNR